MKCAPHLALPCSHYVLPKLLTFAQAPRTNTLVIGTTNYVPLFRSSNKFASVRLHGGITLSVRHIARRTFPRARGDIEPCRRVGGGVNSRSALSWIPLCPREVSRARALVSRHKLTSLCIEVSLTRRSAPGVFIDCRHRNPGRRLSLPLQSAAGYFIGGSVGCLCGRSIRAATVVPVMVVKCAGRRDRI